MRPPKRMVEIKSHDSFTVVSRILAQGLASYTPALAREPVCLAHLMRPRPAVGPHQKSVVSTKLCLIGICCRGVRDLTCPWG
jgi:hypothetical protein